MPTDDYIKRSDALEAMITCKSLTPIARLEAVNRIMPIPAADVEPVRRGRWVHVTNGRGGFECNLCSGYAASYQSGSDYLSAWCPNCGAKMDKEADNGDK